MFEPTFTIFIPKARKSKQITETCVILPSKQTPKFVLNPKFVFLKVRLTVHSPDPVTFLNIKHNKIVGKIKQLFLTISDHDQ